MSLSIYQTQYAPDGWKTRPTYVNTLAAPVSELNANDAHFSTLEVGSVVTGGVPEAAQTGYTAANWTDFAQDAYLPLYNRPGVIMTSGDPAVWSNDENLVALPPYSSVSQVVMSTPTALVGGVPTITGTPTAPLGLTTGILRQSDPSSTPPLIIVTAPTTMAALARGTPVFVSGISSNGSIVTLQWGPLGTEGSGGYPSTGVGGGLSQGLAYVRVPMNPAGGLLSAGSVQVHITYKRLYSIDYDHSYLNP